MARFVARAAAGLYVKFLKCRKHTVGNISSNVVNDWAYDIFNACAYDLLKLLLHAATSSK